MPKDLDPLHGSQNRLLLRCTGIAYDVDGGSNADTGGDAITMGPISSTLP